MASRSLSSLRTAVRQRADMENSTFVTDAEVNAYINDSLGELHDILVTANEDYYTTFTTFTLTSASNLQVLPTDFLKLVRLEIQDSSGPTQYRKVPRFAREEMERASSAYRRAYALAPYRAYRIFENAIWMLPEDDASGTYRLFYVREFQPLVNDTDETANWQRWTDYAVVDAAIKCLAKEESDTSVLQDAKARLLQRIEAACRPRDVSEPAHFEDVTSARQSPWGDPWG